MPQPPTPGVRAAQQGSLLPIPAGGERKARQATPLTRRYEIVALTAAGRPREFTAVAPASPAFEAAFGAYARGTLIATPEGPVAVEDIAPGDMVETADEGAKPLLWKGAMTIFPDMPDVARRPGDQDQRLVLPLAASGTLGLVALRSHGPSGPHNGVRRPRRGASGCGRGRAVYRRPRRRNVA